MSGQVILYFEDQADALRFTLAAGSVMAGEANRSTNDLVQETTRATRIRLNAANKGRNNQSKQPNLNSDSSLSSNSESSASSNSNSHSHSKDRVA